MKKSLMMMLLSVIVSSTSFAETPVGNDEGISENLDILDSITLGEIEKGILYLLRCCPNHAVVRRPDYRMKLVVAFYKAALKSRYDWETLVSIAYAESSFSPESEGPMGEVGLMQLHTERPWRHCAYKEKRPIDRNDIEDQIICGAHWLRFGQDRVCNGTVEQGIAKFMTRGTCKPEDGTTLDWKVNHRLKMRKVLGSDKVQVEFEKKRKVYEKRRSDYISKRQARRRAKLQAKWDARYRKRQKAKRQAKLLAKQESKQDYWRGPDTTQIEIEKETKWTAKPRIKPQPERIKNWRAISNSKDRNEG